MENESSEELQFINREVNAQDLKYYAQDLNDEDETNIVKYIEEIEIDPYTFWMANCFLMISAQGNLQQIVKAVLKRFERNRKYLNVKETARTAVQNGHHVILGELLKVEPEISHYFILSVCLKLGEPRKQEINDTLLRSNLKTCLELILKQINVDVGCIDIADISSVLSAYFDDCLKKIRNQTNEDVIEYDYRCLMSHNIFSKQNTTHRGTCETEVFLLDIARNKNLNHLLKHPLLSSFLYHKWFKIRRILYMNIVFYGIFYFLLNTYILNMIYKSSPNENGTQTVNDSFDVIFNSTVLIRFYPESLLWVFVIVLWLLFTIWEILLFACCPRRYLMNWGNWPQIVLLIFTLILLCGVGLWCGVIVIILSALMMINMVRQHPKMSTNFEIFWIVSRVCVCLLLPCMFSIIVSFGLTFHILFKSNRDFSNPWDSFFKTLLIEFNSNDISVDSYPVLSYIMLVLLAFIIIVLFFVISVALSNTNKMLSEAELNGLIFRIHLIIYLENIAFGEPFSWFSRFSRGNSCLLRWKPFSFLRNRIFLFPPHYLENGEITLFTNYANVIYSNSVNYNKLSPSLKMDPDIIKKAERIISDKNQSVK